MMSNKEIVTMVSGECSGASANPTRQLTKPVFIIVDINREGDRRVSCPFLKGVSRPDKNIIWFCEARRSRDNVTLDKVIDNIIDQGNATLSEDKSEMEYFEAALPKITAQFPQCLYKTPS